MTSFPGPGPVALGPFTVDPSAAIQHLEVRVFRSTATQLLLEYELRGPLAGLQIGLPCAPGERHTEPTDGLWRHTCMEAFLRPMPAQGPYLEFNFSPDGRWAAYRFSGYREGMSPLSLAEPPRIELRTQPERLLLSVQVQLPEAFAAPRLHLGLAVVAEAIQGPLSYWAVRHAGERPDFHHPDSFELEI